VSTGRNTIAAVETPQLLLFGGRTAGGGRTAQIFSDWARNH